MAAGKKMDGEGRAAGTGEAREEEEGGGEGEDEVDGQARERGEEPGVGRRELCEECTERWAMIDAAGVCLMLS